MEESVDLFEEAKDVPTAFVLSNSGRCLKVYILQLHELQKTLLRLQDEMAALVPAQGTNFNKNHEEALNSPTFPFKPPLLQLQRVTSTGPGPFIESGIGFPMFRSTAGGFGTEHFGMRTSDSTGGFGLGNHFGLKSSESGGFMPTRKSTLPYGILKRLEKIKTELNSCVKGQQQRLTEMRFAIMNCPVTKIQIQSFFKRILKRYEQQRLAAKQQIFKLEEKVQKFEEVAQQTKDGQNHQYTQFKRLLPIGFAQERFSTQKEGRMEQLRLMLLKNKQLRRTATTLIPHFELKLATFQQQQENLMQNRFRPTYEEIFSLILLRTQFMSHIEAQRLTRLRNKQQALSRKVEHLEAAIRAMRQMPLKHHLNLITKTDLFLQMKQERKYVEQIFKNGEYFFTPQACQLKRCRSLD